MLKKSFLIFIFCFPIFVFCQKNNLDLSKNKEILLKLEQYSPQQLYDMANVFFDRWAFDTALFCYNRFIGMAKKNPDIEQQKKVIDALNKTAGIYYYMSDYRTAYELFIKALNQCENVDDPAVKSKVYANIGNIYARFKKDDLAKNYYEMALDLCSDSVSMVVILNNLGDACLELGELDSAFFYLNKSLQINETVHYSNLHLILNTMASYYQKSERYDTAAYYYHWSLNEAKKVNREDKEAEYLSSLGKMFYEIHKRDSSLFYVGLSNEIAKRNNLLDIMSENYLIMSKIEETRGDIWSAFWHFKKYENLKDSVLNVEIFGDIHQLQRLYEVSKTNQQIEELVIEQQINERTIYYKNIIQMITLAVLILVSVILFFILLQKRRLDNAYKTLFLKNIEIIELQDHSHNEHPEKYKSSALSDNMQDELLDKILTLMEDTTIICDTEFSLDKLADLVQSNQAYVSQVINNTLKKNFRSFLNRYRIMEAQRLYSELDTNKYTVESVALRVGFKSPSAFRSTFKEITGVSPSFYLRSVQEQRAG